ncbi:hypothetical protein V8C86DRAFT_1437567 [Haematococcus lacustris]
MAEATGAVCMLGYPDRFKAAQQFVQTGPPGRKAVSTRSRMSSGPTQGPRIALPAGSKPLSQEAQLVLYALGQQASAGPCRESKPWGWNVVESAKHQAWRQLGDMSAVEAMRLYVRTVEEEQPEWYGLLTHTEPGSPAVQAAAAAPAAEDKVETAGPAAAPAPAPDPKPEPVAPAVLPVLPASSYAKELSWVQLPTAATGSSEARRPCPRYEHGAALVGHRLYVVAGNYAGRYLSDMWVLDTLSLQWSPLQPQRSPSRQADATPSPTAPVELVSLPPIAGHTVTVWGSKLYIMGGHAKGRAQTLGLPVYVYDTADNTLVALDTDGRAPCARGGHSATLINGRVWVFGGEDSGRRPLSDLHCLDLASATWSQAWPLPSAAQGQAHDTAAQRQGGKRVLPPGPPSARSAHAAAAYLDRYLLIFGGGSTATCYADVAVLDTEVVFPGGGTCAAWLSVPVTGHKVSPRAGHSGAVVGSAWYVVGGGNNIKGCTDLLALDLSQLPEGGPLVWHCLASTPPRDPLSTEGVSLLLLPPPAPTPAPTGNGLAAAVVSHTRGSVLLAFGGYNGKYHNTLSVLRCPPSLPTVPRPAGKSPSPVAAAAAAGGQHPAPAAAEASPPQPTAAEAAEGAGTGVPSKPPPNALPDPTPAAAEAAAAAAAQSRICELEAELAAAQKQAEVAVSEAAAAKEGAAHELALLRKQLAACQAQLDMAARAVEEARGASQRESSRVMRLEAEAAELQRRLAVAGEERKELEALRRQVQEAAEAAAKKGSGGLWGFIAGSSTAS